MADSFASSRPRCSALIAAAAAGASVGAMAVALLLRKSRGPKYKELGSKAGGAHAPMLLSECGQQVLKPLDQGARSARELRAYEQLQRQPIGVFLCTYHGERWVQGFEHSFIVLDSAYYGMIGPTATLDIKLGRKTWEDNASEEKIRKESAKFQEVYAESSAKDGYRVAGMVAGGLRLWNENLKARKSLLPEEFGAWLLPALFANGEGYGPLPKGLAGQCQPEARGSKIDLGSAAEVLQVLKAMSAVAELGFGGDIRASSVLITREMRMGGRWSVKLIDFAHYSPYKTGSEGKRDDNFCDGLAALVKTWSAWLKSSGAPAQ
eukprot:TRINITY_DN40975_c0_g1_i1.p1 TRINITY_DN40975_c0_g1~~TRINITY_DN40975_c0_g1_i1.p1  ORF type:complete len:350 (+),score=73.23 TRINITY_DN40975_c0_g1_i1:88-1050(+)